MNPAAYKLFKDTESLPIAKWEEIYAQTTDPEERNHMRIAIDARKRLENTDG